MKDRYSYKIGTAIPNPGLIPEKAVNCDLAYCETVGPFGSYKASLFYNNLNDVIQQVNNVQGSLSQMQNLGKARYYGGEIELDARLAPIISAEAHYTLLKRENITNPQIKFLDTPDHKIMISTTVDPLTLLDVAVSMEYNSKRYSTSDGMYTASPFTIYHIGMSLTLTGKLKLDAGIQNLFDKNYALTEGYPEPGRTFYASLRIRN